MPRRSASPAAFSLIEAAIVLGIIGLVLGAIWVASAQIRREQLNNTLTTAVLQIVQKIRTNYNIDQYPTSCCGSNNVTNFLYNTNAAPGFGLRSSLLLSPDGTTISVLLQYTTTPRINMIIYRTGGFTPQACTNFVGKLGRLAKDRLNISYVQINSSGPAQILWPPYNATSLATIKCGDDLTYLQLWFEP